MFLHIEQLEGDLREDAFDLVIFSSGGVMTSSSGVRQSIVMNVISCVFYGLYC